MRNKKGDSSSESFLYLKIFLFILGGVIASSLLLRILSYVRESTFRTSHFIMLITGKNWYLVGIDQNLKKISTIEIKNPPSGKITRDAQHFLSLALGIPIDAVVLGEGKNFPDFQRSFFSKDTAIHLLLKREDNLLGMNKLDLGKIYLLSLSFSKTKVRSITLSKDQTETDDLLYDVLSDDMLKNEKTSIEVLNATGVNGVGGAVGRVLKNVGFNVISIGTTDATASSKIIYRIEKNYSLERLLDIFHFASTFRNESGIADATVTLGQDYGQKYFPLH